MFHSRAVPYSNDSSQRWSVVRFVCGRDIAVSLGVPIRTGNFSTLTTGTQMITSTQNDSRIFQFAGKLFF